MNSDIQIREYKSSDRGRLTLCIEALKDFESQFDKDYKKGEEAAIELSNALEIDIQEKKGKIYIAEKGRSIIGFISCHVDLKNDPLILKEIEVLYISDLVVLEEYRSLGIGKQLLEIAESYAKNLNVKFIKLIVFDKNDKAKNFYTINGFEGYELHMIKPI